MTQGLGVDDPGVGATRENIQRRRDRLARQLTRRFDREPGDVRLQDDIRELQQARRDRGFVDEDIQRRGAKVARGQRVDKCGLVYELPS